MKTKKKKCKQTRERIVHFQAKVKKLKFGWKFPTNLKKNNIQLFVNIQWIIQLKNIYQNNEWKVFKTLKPYCIKRHRTM